MLNFLLFSQKIDNDSYRCYYSALENIAGYSEAVWEFGKHIYTAVKWEVQHGTLLLLKPDGGGYI
jgi:hypothetical protein